MAAGARMPTSGTCTVLTGHSTAQALGKYRVLNILIMPICPLCAVSLELGCPTIAGRHAASASAGAVGKILLGWTISIDNL